MSVRENKNTADNVWQVDEGDGEVYWIARHPHLPGCFATGATKGEAIARREEAKIDYLAALSEFRGGGKKP